MYRPVTTFKRNEIVNYLKRHKIDHVVDTVYWTIDIKHNGKEYCISGYSDDNGELDGYMLDRKYFRNQLLVVDHLREKLGM